MSVHAYVRLQEVDVQALDAARLESLVGAERMARFEEVADAAQASLAGHAVLNVNSTATGGGVAEMLQTLLAYARGAGIDARWLVTRAILSSLRSRSGFITGSMVPPVTAARSATLRGATTSGCCVATPMSCSPWFGRVMWC